jgi:hypothetical protein
MGRPIIILEKICDLLRENVEFINSIKEEDFNKLSKDITYSIQESINEFKYLKEFPYDSADKN